MSLQRTGTAGDDGWLAGRLIWFGKDAGTPVLIEVVDRTEIESAASPVRARSTFERLPDLIGAATAGFAIPAMALLLSDYYRVPLVILAGGCGAVATVVAVVRHDAEPARPWDRLWTVAALAVSLLFLCGNAGHSAQSVDTSGPAGVHALAGQWLVHHHTLAVPLHGEVFGDANLRETLGITPGAPGFRVEPGSPDVALPAGSHLLPALLGVTGWFSGPVGLFGTNALIGAFAMFALFGLVRRFASSGFALVASAALGVSIPMVAAARSTLVEPLLVLLLAGGLSVFWRALQTHRAAQFLVAGLTIGAAVIGGAGGFVAALVLLTVAVALLATADRGERGRRFGRVCLVGAGALVPASIGYFDLVRLGADLYPASHDQVVRLAGLAGVAALVGTVVVVVAWVAPVRWLTPGASARVRGAWLAVAVMMLTFAVLASRPLWLDGPAAHSVRWIAWYYCWPMVVGAALGFAVFIHRMVRHGDLRLLVPVTVAAVAAAWRLGDPDVAPEQVAATRQLLPVVVPALLAASGYLLYQIAARGRWHRHLTAVLGLALVGVPAYVTYPLWSVRPDVAQLAGVRAVCAALPDDAAVLSLGTPAVDLYTQAMRSFCNVPSFAMVAPDPGPGGPVALRRVRTEVVRHHRRLYVLAVSSQVFPPESASRFTDAFLVTRAWVWPQRLGGTLRVPVNRTARVLLGTVGPDGTVTPVSGVS